MPDRRSISREAPLATTLPSPGGKLARRTACPVCGNGTLRSIYALDAIPAQSCVLLNSAESARSFPQGCMDLAYCGECGLLTNRAFAPELIDNRLEYEASQGFSMTFGTFAESLAKGFIEKYDLRGKRIAEIGCGAGEFLALLCTHGNNEGVGIDSAGDPTRLPAEVADRIRIVQESFSESHRELIGEAIVCRHTLEHIPDVHEFLTMLRRAIGDRTETVLFFEVPDTMRILRDGAFWDVYHEHCTYFTAGSLVRAFRHAGFDVLDVRLAYGDQYLLLEARPATNATDEVAIPIADDLNEVAQAASSFAERVELQVRGWREYIGSRYEAGRRMIVWGSGSKAVGFLTTLGMGEEIARIVDINPHKRGRYSPGTGHRIVLPRDVAEFYPESVIIMNPVYREEILASLREIGCDPEIRAVGDSF